MTATVSQALARAAIYARYSSDMPAERSIEDQVRLYRARAERDGWEVVEVYADFAISGTIAGRPRFQQLIADARGGRFSVILAEAPDRISRDRQHIAGFHKQVSFAGARVVTIVEGDITELRVGLKGNDVGALPEGPRPEDPPRPGRPRARRRQWRRAELWIWVRRGLRPDGTAIAGALDIVPEEEAIVRRIFEAYVAGRSPRCIANRDRAARQGALVGQQAKLDRQVRNLLDLIKDGHGSPAMVGELREIARRRESLQAEIASAGEPEPVAVLHPKLPELYRRRVEALEEALKDEATAMLAAEALRALTDAILVPPGERRGDVTLSLRGDVAAFLKVSETKRGLHNEKAVHLSGNGRSVGVLGTWVAGPGFEPGTFRL